MASPKSGKAGKAISPAEPRQAEEADDADPGKVAEAKRAQKAAGKGKYGLTPVKPHKPDPAKDPEECSWIEIELLDEADQPVPGESYKVTLPDGQTVAEGTLDQNGFARVDGIDPGSCKVTFPNLDEKTWKPK